METGGGAEDDGFRVVGQEDVVMDVGLVRKMSCDGFGGGGSGGCHVMDVGW